MVSRNERAAFGRVENGWARQLGRGLVRAESLVRGVVPQSEIVSWRIVSCSLVLGVPDGRGKSCSREDSEKNGLDW